MLPLFHRRSLHQRWGGGGGGVGQQGPRWSSAAAGDGGCCVGLQRPLPQPLREWWLLRFGFGSQLIPFLAAAVRFAAVASEPASVSSSCFGLQAHQRTPVSGSVTLRRLESTSATSSQPPPRPLRPLNAGAEISPFPRSRNGGGADLAVLSAGVAGVSTELFQGFLPRLAAAVFFYSSGFRFYRSRGVVSVFALGAATVTWADFGRFLTGFRDRLGISR